MLTRLRLCLKFSSDKNKLKLKFKLPHNDIIQPPKQIQPKVFKLSRKKITDQILSQTQPQYSQSIQYKSKTQIAYQQNINKKINENLATSKFYEYQLKRGEDLIDDVPVDPYYQYKFADLQLEVQARKKLLDDLKGTQTFSDQSKFQKLKALVTGYQTKKHRYEIQQFFKNLKKYPGSVKGPNPQDDPIVFGQFLNKIIPQWVKAELSLQSDQLQNRNLSQETEKVNIGSLATQYFSKQPKLSYPTQQKNDRIEQQMLQDLDNAPVLMNYSPVSQLPHTKFQEYHSYMQKIRMWAKFKKYYDRINKKKTIKQLQNSFKDIGIAKLKKKAGTNDISKLKKKQLKKLKSVRLQPKIYSLYTYYKTLPKQIQENPGVRTTYLGLQYSSPDIPYQQKQQLLNQAAAMSLPLDKFSDAAMEKLTAKDRSLLNPQLTDRIFNMNPQFTWDMKQFLNQVKNQKLRSISTVKEKQQSYPEPPQLYKVWEQGMANLPVDFYDNEDGFWDEHIDNKLKNYQKIQPLSKKPKTHFIH